MDRFIEASVEMRLQFAGTDCVTGVDSGNGS
jgi:hypothetical protein